MNSSGGVVPPNHKVLRNLLRTEYGLQKIQRFLERQFPDDRFIPQFWFECEHHRQLQGSENLSMSALEICVKYLSATAECKVILNHGLCQQLVSHAQDGGQAFFERAQQEIFWKIYRIFSLHPSAFTELASADSSTSVAEGPVVFERRPAADADMSKFKSRQKALRRALSAEKDTFKRPRRRKVPKRRTGSAAVMLPSGPTRDDDDGRVSPIQVVSAKLFVHGLSMMVHCHVLDYDDVTAEHVGGLELGIHSYHRKLGKRETEHPMVRRRREWSERLGDVWTPSNSRHEGLKSALISANEHMETSPVQYTFSESKGVVYTVCKDGAIVKFTFTDRGALERVTFDAALQSKVRDYGAITSMVRGSGGILFRLAGIGTVGRLQLYSDGSTAVELNARERDMFMYHSLQDLSAMRGGSSPAGRHGGYVRANRAGTVIASWWPSAAVNAAVTHNVVLSFVDVSRPQWDVCSLEAFQSVSEVVDVFWGEQASDLFVLSTDVSPTFDSVITLKHYSVAISSKRGVAHGSDLAGGSLRSMKGHADTLASVTKLNTTTAVLGGGISVHAYSSASNLLVLVGQGGDIMILDPSSQETIEALGDFREPSAVSWHPHGVIIAIAAQNKVYLYDAVLVPLVVSVAGEEPVPAPSLTLPFALDPSTMAVQSLCWSHDQNIPPEALEMAGLSAACNQLIVTVQGFPLIVLRFVVDGPEPHFMRMKWAITGRLACNQGADAAKLLRRVDWKDDTAVAFGLLSDVVNHFLVQPFSPQNNNAIREAFPSFAWDIADVEPQSYTMWDSRIQALQRRYFQYLLSNRKLVLALYLATELRSREMCLALATAADDLDGERARFVAITARTAWKMTDASTVSFV
eukprot:m.1073745 g.1073745  ORF g.1073745 m.1073745 type:complete len:862 (-) comp24236_c0_seq7:3102-5687(-)